MSDQSSNNQEDLLSSAVMLREQARQLMEQGMSEESNRTLEQAKSHYIKLNHKPGLVSCLMIQADLMMRLKQLDKAIEVLQKSQALFRELEDIKGFANCLGRQAEVFQRARQPQQALALLKQQGDIYAKIKDRKGLAGNFIAKGLLAARSSQPEKALELFKAAETHAANHPSLLADCRKYIEELQKILQLEAPASSDSPAPEKTSPPQQEETLPAPEEAPAPVAEAPAPVQTQPVEPEPVTTPPPPEPPEPPEPIQEEEQSPDLPVQPVQPDQTVKEPPSLEVSPAVENILAQVELLIDKKSRDYAPYEAEQMLRRAIDEAKERDAMVDMATMLETLGDVFYRDLEMSDNALGNLKKAEETWMRLGHKARAALCMGKQAVVLLTQSKEEQAFPLMDREEEIWSELDDPIRLAYCYFRRGRVYSKKNQRETALEHLEKGAQLLRETGEAGYENLAENLWEQGEIYGELKQRHKQGRYWKQAVDLIRKADMRDPHWEKLLKKLLKKYKIKL